MGVWANLSKSFNKSKQLQKLQREIAPPGRGVKDILEDFRSGGLQQQKEALSEFLDLCVEDEGVQRVLTTYSLNRENLEQIYINLQAGGLGKWVRGHYVPLSTIAYFEPLLYFVESQKRGVPRLTIMSNLLDYWEGRIKQGGLIQGLNKIQ